MKTTNNELFEYVKRIRAELEAIYNGSTNETNEDGERRPNSREEWLDVQARALYQAARIIRNIYRGILAQKGV